MSHIRSYLIILLGLLLLPCLILGQVNQKTQKKSQSKEVKTQTATKKVAPAAIQGADMKMATKLEVDFGTVTDFTGKVYNTKKVGNQWWMMKDFSCSYNAYGMHIPDQLPSAWGDPNIIIGDGGYQYIAITQDQQTTEFMGLKPARYSDASPSGIQGLCPVGWHIPSLAEYEELFEFFGGRDVAAPKMRDELNFHNSWYWTTSGGPSGIYYIELRDYTDQVQVFDVTGNYRRGLRCVKD